MEDKKQGLFSTLKRELARGLSPSRSRPMSPTLTGSNLLNRRKNSNSSDEGYNVEQLIARSGSLTLEPLLEGPDGGDGDGNRVGSSGLGQWVKGQFLRNKSVSEVGGGRFKGSDMRMLIGVMGAPLGPIHVSSMDPFPLLSIKDTPIENSSAQYILQQYVAACGGQKLQNSVTNVYAMGKVSMLASQFETATKVVKNKNGPKGAESGSFVLWQMNPDMWYIELAVGGSKVHAGCNGKLVWRHTPRLGAHTAKGPVRPLRRALQGLDPRATARIFADARCVGERKINGEDCFTLKLSADSQTLSARSEGPAEIIRHVLFGYFSQKTGLLVHIEDSHLTRIQSNCGDVVYWETTISSSLDDYKSVDGIMIAHSGRSVVTLYRFGEVAMSHTRSKMEETWTIEEVAFNVPGLSVDCFIPPADLRTSSITETCEILQDERVNNAIALASQWSKVAAIEKHDSSTGGFIRKREV